MRPGDQGMMVTLGPSFTEGGAESRLVRWEAVTVLSLGKEFSILLSADPAAWSTRGPGRSPVCLAIADDRAFICTNASPSPNQYFPYFVDVETGALFERAPPGIVAFTNAWEIAFLGAERPPRTILKYPLPASEASEERAV